MMDLFPVFLKLQARRCLVVGAASIAEQKLPSLLAAGADVRVVAPAATEHIRRLAHRGALMWSEREFAPADLDGIFLVIAASGNAAVNETVFREAERRGVLCNAVDEPERCHFYYPAVLRRGQLQIAISTAGQSPALAQRLRTELEAAFDPEYGAWVAWLGRVRRLFFKRQIDPQRRTRALHHIASRGVYERFARAQARRSGGAL